AASKAKGMWMGGSVPLGYEPEGRTLTVVAEEAEAVRLIFQLYLELGSVHALEAELRSRGVRSKMRTSAAGRTSGGALFSRGALFHLLQNRIYLGEIRHRDKWWPGLHRPIIDAELFERVQANLAANRTERARERAESPAVLTGVLRNAAGEPLTPTHARGRSGGTYRYYVAAPLQQGRGSDDRVIRRLPGAALETHIAEQLRSILQEPGAGWTELRPCLQLVTVSASRIDVRLDEKATRTTFPVAAGALESVCGVFTIRLAALISRRGGRTWLHADSDRSSRKPDRALIKALRRAHREMAAAGVSLLSSKPSWEQLRGIDDPYLRKLSRLAFLSPSIQRAIMEGRHPPGLTLQELLSEMPLSWEEQHRRFCFAGA
ncbi:MAG TPA: recombinase family protein, partial [Caulobacteraceae bacterium]|nr:recombinase family protein [Caulobacteraceae bacterium]